MNMVKYGEQISHNISNETFFRFYCINASIQLLFYLFAEPIPLFFLKNIILKFNFKINNRAKESSTQEDSIPETSQAQPTTTPKQANYIRFTKGDNLEDYTDDVAVLTEKAILMTKCLQQSKHCIVFTGAGISTSAKLPEYLFILLMINY